VAGRNVKFVTTIPGRCALSVNDAGMPTPEGWAWTPLSDIARLESGHTPSRSHPEYWDGDIAWIGIKDAREHHGTVINDTSQHVTQAGIDNSAARLLPAKTVCLSRTASVGYVVLMGRPMATSQDFVNWICSPAIDPDFLKWILLAEGEEGLRKFGKGTTHTTIYFPEVEAFHACIPPLNEQRRIVGKLDSVFELTRAGRARLERLPALLEKLKRSILAAAFRGDLTKEWRTAHPDVEPASALLDRVRADHRRSWEEGLREKGKDPRKATYTEYLPDLETVPQGDLPATWARACVADVAECLDSQRVPVSREERAKRLGPYPYYGANGPVDTIGDFIFDDELVLVTEDETFYGRVKPIAYRVSGKCWVNNHAHVLRSRGHVGSDLLCRMLMHYPVEPWLSGTTGRAKLTQGDLLRLPVALAPKDECREIESRLEASLAAIDQLRDQAAIALQKNSALEQAALAKAFRGELVPQDPCDEPVSTLLDRIRAARAAEPERPRRRRGGPGVDTTGAETVATSSSNGHATNRDESLDLVVGIFQIDRRLTAAAIAEATGLDALAVKKALKALVDDGHLRVQKRTRVAIYEWTS